MPARAEVRPPSPHPSGAVVPRIPSEFVPRHVAIVMDGNGRWAKDRGLPRTAGHEAGESSLFDVVEGAIELGVGWVSAYAFSTENWSRSADEVRFLMGFNRDVIRRRRDEMHALGVRVRWAGRTPRLWRSVVKELQVTEATWYRWVNQYGSEKNAESSKRTRELEKENARLKKLLADQILANDILSEVAKGKF